MSEDQNDPRNGAHGTRRSRWTRAAAAALSGVIAGFCALAVAELVAAVVRPEAGPVAAVGGAVIDRAPPALKDFAVRNFGTNDKLVLQLGILALLAVFAMAVGVLALRHRLLGSAAVLVFGVVGAVSAVGRPEGGPSDALPSLVGAVVAAGVLYVLAGRLTPAPGPSPRLAGRAGSRLLAPSTGGGSSSRPASRRLPRRAPDSWDAVSPPPCRPEPTPHGATWSCRYPIRRRRPYPRAPISESGA